MPRFRPCREFDKVLGPGNWELTIGSAKTAMTTSVPSPAAGQAYEAYVIRPDGRIEHLYRVTSDQAEPSPPAGGCQAESSPSFGPGGAGPRVNRRRVWADARSRPIGVVWRVWPKGQDVAQTPFRRSSPVWWAAPLPKHGTLRRRQPGGRALSAEIAPLHGMTRIFPDSRRAEPSSNRAPP